VGGGGEPTADFERYSGSKLVRLGVFTEAPPFVFRDLQNNIVGVDIEIVEHICRRLGYRLEVNPMSMDSLFDSLIDDTSDVIAASISITDERRQLGIFGTPYYKAGVSALVMANR
jgi:ABC-type amino acid transport/signal transduction systems, periplasmic component/domain